MWSGFVVGLAMCRNRKQSSSQSPNGRMSKSRLWIALTFFLMPTHTCHGSDCQPVTCMVIQGLGQASERAVVEGWMPVPPREKKNCSDTFSLQLLEFTHLKNSHVQLMSFPRPFAGASCTRALIIVRSSMKVLKREWSGGLWRSTDWRDLHIDAKGWRRRLKLCLLWIILCIHCDFIQLWFLPFLNSQDQVC